MINRIKILLFIIMHPNKHKNIKKFKKYIY
jgi:hypothetical protein